MRAQAALARTSRGPRPPAESLSERAFWVGRTIPGKIARRCAVPYPFRGQFGQKGRSSPLTIAVALVARRLRPLRRIVSGRDRKMRSG